jgi:hypothetical protein
LATPVHDNIPQRDGTALYDDLLDSRVDSIDDWDADDGGEVSRCDVDPEQLRGPAKEPDQHHKGTSS